MDDLDEFRALNGRQGATCPIGIALRDLKPADRRKLTKALAESDVQSSAITRWLREHDRHVGDTAVARHRRKACACGR